MMHLCAAEKSVDVMMIEFLYSGTLFLDYVLNILYN